MHTFPVGSSPERQTTNVEATNLLLGVINQEALHPKTVISSEVWFSVDNEFDAVLGPQMVEIADPSDDNNTYHVGVRPDGIGQVVMLQRERGGVVSRVGLTLRHGVPTGAFGERQEPYGQHGLTQRNILDGDPAEPALLLQLSNTLPEAFEVRRQRIARQEKSKTALGRIGLAIGAKVAQLRDHAAKDDRRLPELP